MKTIYLMRHAKSSWQQPDMLDIDRPILKEGVLRTQKVIDYLLKNNIQIKSIVSSPANRAVSTARLVGETYGVNSQDILIAKQLYQADKVDFEDTIYSLPDTWSHVLLVSHNPGITDFANSFIQTNKIDSIPTSGIVAINLDINQWTDLRLAKAVVDFILYPKNINI